MRAYELPADIDDEGRISAKLPQPISLSTAKLIVLIDDTCDAFTSEMPRKPKQPTSFTAIRIETRRLSSQKDDNDGY